MLRRFVSTCLPVLAVLLALIAATSAQALASPIAQNNVVGAVPAAGTPGVDDGIVYAFATVGSATVVGGSFTTVGGVAHRGIFAFDTATNTVSTSFSPVLNGTVNTLWPGPTAGTVYAGGDFTTVNGVTSKGLTLLNLSDGSRVSGFPALAMDGIVNAVKLVGNRLFVGGTFTGIGGYQRGGLATMNATTGVIDAFTHSAVTVNHNWTSTNGAAKAGVGVKDLDITPDGTKMVIIGNFKLVDGQSRDQVALFDLTGAGAVLRSDWATQGYTAACYSWAYDSYVRDVDISPDGSWFVIAATGGGNSGLCDTAARFEFSSTGSSVQPTWSDFAGGDSIYSAAVTGNVVYVGGHMRWLNNPNGNDAPGGGAVPRPGLGALDARTGIPVSWNAARNPRGSGAWTLYATSTGVWVGSDTDYIGNNQYLRKKMAFFPLSSGAPLAADPASALPTGVYLGNSAAPTGNTYGRRNFTGTSADALTPLSTPLSLTDTRGTVLIGNRLFYATAAGNLYFRTYDGTTFGAETTVDPYNDPYWSDIQTGSGQTYRGLRPSFYTEIPNLTSMFYDAGRIYYTLSGSTGLFYRSFSPDSGVIAANRSQLSGVTMPAVSGAFLAGGTLFYATSADGNLTSVPFSAGTLGSATVVSGPSTTGIDWRGRILFAGPAGAPEPTGEVAFRGAASARSQSAAPAISVPAVVATGDRLLLFATSGSATTATAPAGWTQVAQQASSTVLTTVWQRSAVAGDAGSPVTVTFSASAKVDLKLLAYSGAGAVSTAQTAASASTASHLAPAATVATTGSWVLRYWADKGTTTTSWSIPAGLTLRGSEAGGSDTYVSAAVADSNAPVATGSSATSTATTPAATRDVTATVVLPPAP
jgi:hypothetical protein